MPTFVNATIVDGTSAAPFLGTLTLDGERITRIARQAERLDASAIDPAVQTDLDGRVICPGFIDAHSHNDWFCVRPDNDVFFQSFLRQGITSMVTGNCGFSPSGFAADSPHITDLGGELFSAGEGPPTASFDAWAETAKGLLPVNVAALAGHGTARLSVAGLNGVALTDKQESAMLDLLEQSLQAGAAGISLGLMYAPGLYATPAELVKVADLCQKYDRILTVHARAASALSLNFAKKGRSHLLQALDELDTLTRQSGCRFEYSHLIFVGRRTWKDVGEALTILEAMQRDGFDVGFDMYPYDFGASVITVVLPEWYQRLSRAERKKPWVRPALRGMIFLTSKLLGFGFADIRLAYAGDALPHYTGRLISEIAKAEKRSAFDVYLDVCEQSDFKARVLMSSYQNDAIVDRLMRHPMSVYMTDAWFEEKGQQNVSIYHAFPRFLRLAREKRIPLEATIHKMTGQTAARFRLQERGEIREGFFADLVILNPDAVTDEATPGEPVPGIEAVYVNGQEQLNPIAKQMRTTKAGRVLRVT